MHERINRAAFVILFLIAFNAITWGRIIDTLRANAAPNAEIYFLNVGQGDSSLITIPSSDQRQSVKILIDGGPKQNVIRELEKIIPSNDRYIDLIILTHPQLDHYEGLIGVTKRYRIGAFLFNGRSGTGAFKDLERAIKTEHIPVVQLLANDTIRYHDATLATLAPTPQFLTSGELNETCEVTLFETHNVHALFTGDIDTQVEDYLLHQYPSLHVDILKVAHHGSKYSSEASFLNAIQPKVSVIEVGAKNTYGHPTKEALARLAAIGSKIYRTDQDGTMHLIIDGGSIKVKKGL